MSNRAKKRSIPSTPSTPSTPARVEGTLDPVDALIDVIRTTPKVRQEYMCHGDYHCEYIDDLNTLRKRFAEVLSNVEDMLKNVGQPIGEPVPESRKTP